MSACILGLLWDRSKRQDKEEWRFACIPQKAQMGWILSCMTLSLLFQAPKSINVGIILRISTAAEWPEQPWMKPILTFNPRTPSAKTTYRSIFWHTTVICILVLRTTLWVHNMLQHIFVHDKCLIHAVYHIIVVWWKSNKEKKHWIMSHCGTQRKIFS